MPKLQECAECQARRSTDNSQLPTHMHDSQGHTHTHTQRNTGVHSNKPAPHASHIHRRCDGSPVCQVIWQHLWAPMWPESFQTAGQEAWTAAPHALSSSHPSLLPPHTQTFPSLTSILTHCFSPCRTATLRRARQDKRWWTGHLWCELSPSPANVMDRQLALTWANSRRKQSWSGNPQNTFLGWCFVFAASPRCLCFVVSRVSRWMGSLVGRRVCIGGLLLFAC